MEDDKIERRAGVRMRSYFGIHNHTMYSNLRLL